MSAAPDPRAGRHGALRPAAALLLSAHPGPALAVTALATALTAAVGKPAGTVALVGTAVLTGQLSIGWCNDVLDAARDRAAGRTAKPIASGAVPTRTGALAAGAALVATVPLSLALGPGAGAAHLVTVAGGWAYDLGLKRTPLSWLPYAVAFGALPAVAPLARPDPVAPPLWLLAAGALLGVAAHAFNGLPDVEEDRAAGLAPLPVAIGPTATRWLGAGLLAAAGGVLALGPAGAPGWALATAGSTALLALLAALVGTVAAADDDGPRGRPGDRQARPGWVGELPFVLLVLAAAIDLVLLLVTGAVRGPS